MRKRSETGPARCRRAPARASNVARSRTRQIRRRGACGRAPGGRAARRVPPWCASAGGSRGSWRACDCWAGTCASTKCPLEAVARGPKEGTTREAETTQCTVPTSLDATRSRSLRGPLRRLGKTPAAPCRTRTPVLRCATRSAAGRRPAPQGCRSTTEPNPCNTSRTISTPVDRPVDKTTVDGKTTRSGRERTVSVDGGGDLGPGVGDAA